MSSPLSYDHLLFSGSDDFLYRIMQDHKALIKHIANRFRHLDSMYDSEDLEQEAFFGVRLACNSWAHARAINMQFKTYLTWHISRHFQGRFNGEDKVVDLLDEHGNVRVSIPWSKFRKSGRAAAKARGFSTRIRSLRVYYDDCSTPADNAANPSDSDWHPVHTGEDTIVDILDQDGGLIVTVPKKSYLQVQDLIQDQGYSIAEYSIYDPRPTYQHSNTASLRPTDASKNSSLQSLSCANAPSTSSYVVDVYTSHGNFLTRISMVQYHRFRTYFPKYGLTTRMHNVKLVPEPPEFDEDLLAEPDHASPLSTASAI